ncbi:MAG: ABC transporter permease subunit [Acetobacteraceae bacterium]
MAQSRQVREGSDLALRDGLPAEPLSGRAVLTFFAGAWAWLFLLVLLIFFEGWARLIDRTSFLLNVMNLRSIAVFTAEPFLLAAGQTFVIIAAGIDLSVGFTMGLAAVVLAQVVRFADPLLGPGLAVVVGVVLTLVAAAIPGLINGLLIARLRVPPFIGTLGMYGVAEGAGYLAAGGTTVPVSNPILSWIGNQALLGVPVLVWITILVLVFLHYLLKQSRYGQYTYAIGGNRQAAVRAGINVRRHTEILYVLSALSAAVAGMLYTARFSAGAAQAGDPLLLVSIAAVVIGGASLFGGSGTIVGTLIGALIIAVIQYGLVFINVAPFWQFIAVGVVIIVSVLVDQSRLVLTTGVRADE